MSVRSLQARIECDSQILGHLWQTHKVFNERLPHLIKILFAMKRGECGQNNQQRNLYKRIGQFILENDSQQAEYLLNRVSLKKGTGWNTVKKMKNCDWADEAAELSQKGILLYDKKQVFGDLPATLRQMACRESAAVIRGHKALLKLWEEEHKIWLKEKAEWESKEEHKKYLALRSRFAEFEDEVEGKITKRRKRSHLYLQWLSDNPYLAAWRGGPAVINPLSEKAQKRIKRASPRKKIGVEIEEFLKANPELDDLDELHGYYEREYVRRRKGKKNPDGFNHRPTFTMPHPTTHPRWLVFNAPKSNPPAYKELKLPKKPGEMGSLKMLLITGEKNNGVYPYQWTDVKFKADPRLSSFRSTERLKKCTKGKDKGQMKEADAYEFFDKQFGKYRPADISGAKLIFRLKPDGSPKSAYLYFTCKILNEHFTEKAKEVKWLPTGEKTKKGKERFKKVIPEGLITCGVNLGLPHFGFATLCINQRGMPQILRSRNLWLSYEENGKHPGRLSRGPNLSHIVKHKKKIRYLRHLRGKPVMGEKSHIQLQEHITSMGEDRFKKVARSIINFALNTDNASGKNGTYPRADVLLLEELKGLIPDAENEKGLNKQLEQWNRRHVVDHAKQMAEDAGLKVIEISPFATSQVCSKCGALGRRYSIFKNKKTSQMEITFGLIEKLFACPECDYRADADHNASVNLHRRWLLEDACKSYYDWRKKPKKQRIEKIEEIENTIRKNIL